MQVSGISAVPLLAQNNDIWISAITSPKPLVKGYGEDGTKNADGARIFDATFNTWKVSDLRHLQGFISVLTNKQCLCLGGVRGAFQAQITTNDNQHMFPDAITRSKKHIKWFGDLYPGSFSILFFDFDFSDDLPKVLQARSFNEIRALLLKTIPALEYVHMLIRWSSSSNIIKVDGSPLNNKTSMHIFIAVKNASERNIESFKEYLYRSLWANGLAYCTLSKGDQVLQRSFIDMSVLSAERIIITASPLLPTGWYKAKADEFALYEGGALDLSDIDYTHLPDWHPAFWDAKYALESTIERVSKPKERSVIPNQCYTPFVASTSLNEKLNMIKEKLNQKGGDKLTYKQFVGMIDRDVTQFILQGIGYHVDSNGKFKIREERTASASIRSDGLIKDFGGDFGGNIINFMIDICGLSFKISHKYVCIALGATNLRLKPSDYEPLIDPKLIQNNFKGINHV